MFIYKITVLPINKVYIGLDTKLPYRKQRWKDHCRSSLKENATRKIHKAMKEHGIENCLYEVIDDNFTTMGQLALAEIDYIEKHDSYVNGLNSSLGGDGLGKNGWNLLTEEEILQIRSKLGDRFAEYNRKKWAGTTLEQRKEMVKHCHTPEVIAARVETQLEYYKTVSGAKEKHSAGLSEWRKENPNKVLENGRKNGRRGADKVSKSIKVEFPNGNIVVYKSKMEMKRQTKQWPETLLRKTKLGENHNGYRAWEI